MSKIKPLTCSVYTMEKIIIRSMNVISVSIPTPVGYVSIYKNHVSYITDIHFGELKIVDANNNLISVYVDSGIAEVSNNVISILAHYSSHVKDLDKNIIESEIKRIANEEVINEEERIRNSKKILKLQTQLALIEDIN